MINNGIPETLRMFVGIPRGAYLLIHLEEFANVTSRSMLRRKDSQVHVPRSQPQLVRCNTVAIGLDGGQ